MPRLLGFLFRRLDRRYPRLVLAAQFQFAHLVVMFGLGLLLLYQRMSTEDFVRLTLAAQALILLENLSSIRLVFRMLRPADPWLRGDHSESAAVAAWRALVDLPVAYLRRRKLTPILFNALPWSLYAKYELGLTWISVPILVGGAAVVMLYGVALRYFAMELSMRPVLQEVSGDLPDNFALGRGGVGMGMKLLVALPMLNIITGVVVSGLSTDGTAQLSDLGLDVMVAVAVAFTTSFYVTLLLARSIVGPIRELRDATRDIARGDLSVRVPVVSADEVGSLSQSFNAAVAGLEEREQLHAAFGAYVDPEIADKVLAEGEVLAGEEVEVSVLFLDIRDFTAFAERSSAREVVTSLNEFYERVVPVLTKHGGHANKFVGDGLLGVFGAPDPLGDHADRAVSAACEVASVVADAYGDSLRIGVGVNSGPVVAGTIGGGGRLEFTVIGDAVNTASRVEAVTRVTGDDILVTEATRALLTRDHRRWDERGSVELKGKAEPVRLYAPGLPGGTARRAAGAAVPAD